MSSNFRSLEPEHLDRLDGNQFERLCDRLISLECCVRHVGAEIQPGAAQYVKDGGIDYLVTLKAPARRGREYPDLVHDDLTTTVFSCKTGRGWVDGVADNVNPPEPSRKKTLANRQKDTDWQKWKAKQIPTIRELAKGHRFTVMTNRQLGTEALDQHQNRLVQELEARFKAEGKTPPANLNERVEVVEAGRIVGFMRGYSPSLPTDLLTILGIGVLGPAQSFSEWVNEQTTARGLPGFIEDTKRRTVIENIRRACAAAYEERQPAIWLHGPPGAGKTRLVMQALTENDNLQDRVRVAFGGNQADSTIAAIHGQNSVGDLILVLDECAVADVYYRALALLTRDSFKRGSLIMIGPSPTPGDEPRTEQVDGAHIPPLERETALRLIQQELDPVADDALVERIWDLSEGYPWFTLLLAEALKEDSSILPVGSRQQDAAKLALAGPPSNYENEAAWTQEVVRRSRALFATILTGDLDWLEFDEEKRSRVAAAVRLNWDDLLETAEACWQRNILRRGPGKKWRRKYITPANLARLVAERHLDEEYNRREIIRHLPERRSALYQRLQQLGVREELIAELANNDIDAMDDEPSEPDALARAGPDLLVGLAYYSPNRLGSWLRGLVVEFSREQLINLDLYVRRRVVWALEHLVHRRGSLRDAEEALFRLALAETEDFGNNATSVWRTIFSLHINPTHSALATRTGILDLRLGAEEVAERFLALQGLTTTLSPRGTATFGFTERDHADGEWPPPTPVEVSDARSWAWDRICGLAEADPETTIRARARVLITEHLRGLTFVKEAPSLVVRLTCQVSDWDETERLKLRGAIDQWLAFDLRTEAPAELKTAIDELLDSLSPKDFHERLVSAVGQYTVHLDRSSEEKADLILAREGLAGDVPLRQELAWLASPAAQRGTTFMRQVGRADTDMKLLADLREQARTGQMMDGVVNYLVGVTIIHGQQVLDEIFPRWRSDPELLRAWLRAVVVTEPNERHVGWIIDAIQNGRITPQELAKLAWRPWTAGISEPVIAPLVSLLADDSTVESQFGALTLILERAELHGERARDRYEATLGELLVTIASSPLGTMAAYKWGQAAERLIEWGCAARVAKAAMTVIESGEDWSTQHGWEAWQLAAGADPESAWKYLADRLMQPTPAGGRVLISGSFESVASLVPPEIVLTWAGDDKDRAWRAALMCSAHEAPLNELARQLLIRWGGEGRVAEELAARAHSTGVVHSFSDFFNGQIQNAEEWARDHEPNVAKWGEHMRKVFGRELENARADEEFERRKG